MNATPAAKAPAPLPSLAVFVVAAGLMPQPFIDHMISPAVDALVDRSGYIAAILGGR